jgi:hypothetical protein
LKPIRILGLDYAPNCGEANTRLLACQRGAWRQPARYGVKQLGVFCHNLGDYAKGFKPKAMEIVGDPGILSADQHVAA